MTVFVGGLIPVYLTPPEQPSCCKQVPVAVGLVKAVLLHPWWPAPGAQRAPVAWGRKNAAGRRGCSGSVWSSWTSWGLWGGDHHGSQVAPARTRACSFPQQRRRSPGSGTALAPGAAVLPGCSPQQEPPCGQLEPPSPSAPCHGPGEAKRSTGGEALWSPEQEARAGACLRGGALGSCSSCSSLVRYEGASGKRLR